MANTIITKNSSTASAVPTAGDLVQGELAVNVTDKRLFTEDAGGNIVEIGTNPSTINIDAGTIDGTAIGGTTPTTGAFTTLSASSTVSGTGFSTYLASPPAIGGTAAAAGSFTTLSASGSVTLSGGTANGVAYLNGSKVLTTGSALTFDGTSVFKIYPSTAVQAQTTLQEGGGNTRQLVLKSPALGSNASIYTVNTSAAIEFGISSIEGMRLTSTGLGIGTSSPVAKLDVQPATYTFGTAQAEVIRIRGNASGGTTTSPTSAGALVWGNGTTTQAVINSIIDNPSASSRSALAFSTNIAGTLTEAMRIDSSGNLGLGVTPSAWGSSAKALQLNTTGSFWGVGGQSRVGNNHYFDSGSTFRYLTTGAIATDFSQTSSGFFWNIAPSGTAGNAISFTQAMTLNASGNLGIGTSSPAAKLDVGTQTDPAIAMDSSASGNLRVTGAGYSFAIANNNTGTYLYNNGGSRALVFGTNETERARIDPSGNLLVGSTSGFGARIHAVTSSSSGCISTSATASSGTRYHLVFYENSTERGSVTSNGGGVVYNSLSDYRLKENVAPIAGALAKVAQLNPVTYTWKGSGSSGQGFIAHELQAVVPECVTGEKDAVDANGKPKYQGIDTSFLVATLTAAIQEQQAIIESLKARLDAANL